LLSFGLGAGRLGCEPALIDLFLREKALVVQTLDSSGLLVGLIRKGPLLGRKGCLLLKLGAQKHIVELD
jgi:hypothetical protein